MWSCTYPNAQAPPDADLDGMVAGACATLARYAPLLRGDASALRGSPGAIAGVGARSPAAVAGVGERSPAAVAESARYREDMRTMGGGGESPQAVLPVVPAAGARSAARVRHGPVGALDVPRVRASLRSLALSDAAAPSDATGTPGARARAHSTYALHVCARALTPTARAQVALGAPARCSCRRCGGA